MTQLVIKRFIVMMLCLTGISASAQSSEKQVLYFRSGSSVIEPGYMNNRLAFSCLDSILTPANAPYISSLRIESYASPEGGSQLNERLSRARAEAVRKYIETKYPFVDPSKIWAVGKGVNWIGLYKLVEDDPATPNRSRILHIIDNVPAEINYRTNTSRKKSLMDLGVRTWNYMLTNHFPLLRVGDVYIAIDMKEAIVMEETVSETEPGQEVVVITDSEAEFVAPDKTESDKVAAEDILLPAETTPIKSSDEYIKKPLFAVKTNLLFNVVSALNVEIEVPIGKKWSIAGEYIFPWWLWESKQIAFQTLSFNLEGRYWFGDREQKPQLTGWFAGLYAGGGYYDFESKTRGYQGEFYIASGLTGGYAHTINRSGNLRMEYSLGVGYMKTKYREYVPKMGVDDEWHLIRQGRGRYTWFGPTRAKFSLVWMLNSTHKQKGGVK